MNRKTFLQSLALAPLMGSVVKLKSMNKVLAHLEKTDRMPVLFLGHGSPMNAIEENEFVQGFRNVAANFQKPSAVLCISAHWETRGTMVTAMAHPKTIHDFGGFPQALFEVQYPSPGHPELAQEIKSMVHGADVGLDMDWGLDHGAWSVIKHMYPDADVPVIQMSLDYSKDPRYHFDLARELAALRYKGVLIVGSGNMVHNLREIDWRNMKTDNYSHEWASVASQKFKQLILDGNFDAMVDYQKLGREVLKAVPTPEHFLPLLYTLGLKDKRDEIGLFNDKAVGGSITMTSVMIA